MTRRPDIPALTGLALALIPPFLLAPMSGDDLALYRRMVGSVAPYADPYADFPPLKMAVLWVVERADGWRLFGYLLALALAVAVYAYLRRRGWRGWWAAGAALGIVASPILYAAWYVPFEDKATYPALLLALLVVLPRSRANWPRYAAVGTLCGLLQAYGEMAVVVPVIVALGLWRARERGWRPYAALFGAFAAVVVASHVPYWPDWLAGYARRSARMAFDRPYHQSLWWPLYDVGLYHPRLPTAAMLAGFGMALVLAVRGRVAGAILLAHTSALGLGPEAGWDRLLAAGLPAVGVGLAALEPGRRRLALNQPEEGRPRAGLEVAGSGE